MELTFHKNRFFRSNRQRILFHGCGLSILGLDILTKGFFWSRGVWLRNELQYSEYIKGDLSNRAIYLRRITCQRADSEF